MQADNREDSYVLIAGRSALDLLALRLQRLNGRRVLVLCECGADETISALTNMEMYCITESADRPYALYETLRGLHLPQRMAHVWLACGRAQAAMIRRQLIEDHGVAPNRIESPVVETVSL